MIAADSPILSWFFQFGSLASFPTICALCLGHFTEHDFGLLPLPDYTELSSGRRIIHSFCKINNFQLKCSIIAHSFQFFEHNCVWKLLSQQLRHNVNVYVPLKHPWFQLVYFTAQWTQTVWHDNGLFWLAYWTFFLHFCIARALQEVFFLDF